MAEINNSLALGIKPAEFDILKPLQGAAAINSLRTNTAKVQQDIDYNQRLQDQGQNGMRPQEENTLAEANQKQSELRGRAASEIVQDPSDNGVQSAFKHFEKSGAPLPMEVQKKILAMPPAQRRATALQIQQGSMPAQSSIQQDPALIAKRSQAETGGGLLGGFRGPPGYQPQGAASRGSPTEAPAPDVSLLEQKHSAEISSELTKTQLARHQQASEAAANQKVALRDLMLKAEDVRTGKYAGKEQEARKILQAASEYFPSLKQYSPDKSIAAFESINKDQGLIAREAQKSVGGTAASELSAITESLVGGGTSHGGIVNNGSQLIGLKNAEIAKNIAAQDYFQKNNSLKGFDASFTKNAGPAAWVYMALPPEEQDHIRDSLNKTKAGQATFNSIIRQMHYIHKNKFDEGLE